MVSPIPRATTARMSRLVYRQRLRARMKLGGVVLLLGRHAHSQLPEDDVQVPSGRNCDENRRICLLARPSTRMTSCEG